MPIQEQNDVRWEISKSSDSSRIISKDKRLGGKLGKTNDHPEYKNIPQRSAWFYAGQSCPA